MAARGVDNEGLRRASARLGEAALDPTLWPEIMQEICMAVGARGAALLQSDIRTPDVPHTAGVEEMFSRYFAEGWHKHDIRAERGVPLLLRGDPVVTDQDLVSPDEMHAAGFYRDFLPSTEFQWFAVIGFRAGPALWGLSIQRTRQEGPFDAADKCLLGELSPRLTEVATLSTTVGRIALSGAIRVLEAVHQPAIALNRLGFVIDANAEAERIFDDEIRIERRRLAVGDSRSRADLDTFLDRLRATSDWVALAAEPILIRRVKKLPLLIRVVPIDGAARGPFLGARVLLILHDLEVRSTPKPNDILNIFGLSGAEARLAARLATGISIETAAEELGIARETARNQLKSVFAKTGTHRQSELVALLARL